MAPKNIGTYIMHKLNTENIHKYLQQQNKYWKYTQISAVTNQAKS
jgi:hypothetical protein